MPPFIAAKMLFRMVSFIAGTPLIFKRKAAEKLLVLLLSSVLCNIFTLEPMFAIRALPKIVLSNCTILLATVKASAKVFPPET